MAFWGADATIILTLSCRAAASRLVGGYTAEPAGCAAAAGQWHCTAHQRHCLAPLAGRCASTDWGNKILTLRPHNPSCPIQMLTPGPAPEGYVVLYRCLLPASTAWSQQDVGRELSTIIPALKRGYQYEFKVRPYAGGTQGLDSNSWHLWIPEEGRLEWWEGRCAELCGVPRGSVLLSQQCQARHPSVSPWAKLHRGMVPSS